MHVKQKKKSDRNRVKAENVKCACSFMWINAINRVTTNYTVPQKEFPKPMIASDQRSPKKRPNIAPLLDDDLKADLI